MTENLGLIIAIVGTGIAMVGVMLALFLWTRGEANADRRDIVNLIVGIKDEYKDFHARLCVIEAERNQILRERRK